MNPQLAALIDLFVKKEKRERMRALASKASRRADLCSDLLHDRRSLDERVLRALPASASPTSIARALRAGGGGERVYCIAAYSDLDDRELGLAEALEQLAGKSNDCLVHPLGARVAFYENHEGEQWLLVNDRDPH